MSAAAIPKIALFARYPTPGEAKTRLIPALGAEGAARVHRRLVERTIVTIRESGVPFALWFTGASRAEFAAWLGEDVELVEQGEGDLGERLSRVPVPAILLGADVPGLSAQCLRQAVQGLKANDVVVGPAFDGGYYLLGFNRPVPFLFSDMAWGGEAVFEETMARLGDHGLGALKLEALGDCDRPEDLELHPELLG
jgi:rSAM/selenodomain-associated transferase 1